MFSFNASFGERHFQPGAERWTPRSTSFQPKRPQLQKQSRRGNQVETGRSHGTRFEFRGLGVYESPANRAFATFRCIATFDERYVQQKPERSTSGSPILQAMPEDGPTAQEGAIGQNGSQPWHPIRFRFLFCVNYLPTTQKRRIHAPRLLKRRVFSRQLNGRRVVQPRVGRSAPSFKNNPGETRKSE